MVAIANANPGIAGAQLLIGLIIGAGIISILIAPPVNRMLRFFPPVVTGTIIAVIGTSDGLTIHVRLTRNLQRKWGAVVASAHKFRFEVYKPGSSTSTVQARTPWAVGDADVAHFGVCPTPRSGGLHVPLSKRFCMAAARSVDGGCELSRELLDDLPSLNLASFWKLVTRPLRSSLRSLSRSNE